MSKHLMAPRDAAGPRALAARIGPLQTPKFAINARIVLAFPVAVVVGIAAVDPTFALRQGAVVCAIVLLFSSLSIRLRAADICVLAYTVLAIASSYWTVNTAATELSIKNIVSAALIFLAVRAVATDPRGWSLVGASMVGGGIYAVYRVFFDNQIDRLSLSIDVTGTRYAIENVNANYLSYSMVTGMAIALALAVRQGRRRYAIVLAGILFALYTGVVQAGTRGALTATILALLWVMGTLIGRPEKIRSLKILLTGLALVALSIVSGLFEAITQPFISASVREMGDLNGRFPSWAEARLWWWDHFWLGSGAGTFPSVNNMHIAAHNFVLDIGTGVGLVGVVLFGAILYQVLWKETGYVPQRVMLVGAYALVSAPLLLSGFWIESPVFWSSLGLIGVLGDSWSKSSNIRNYPQKLPGDLK